MMEYRKRNDLILELIDRHTRESIISVEVARETLISEGIYTEDGKLHPDFGGDPQD